MLFFRLFEGAYFSYAWNVIYLYVCLFMLVFIFVFFGVYHTLIHLINMKFTKAGGKALTNDQRLQNSVFLNQCRLLWRDAKVINLSFRFVLNLIVVLQGILSTVLLIVILHFRIFVHVCYLSVSLFSF